MYYFSFCSSYILERMVSVFWCLSKPLIHIDLGSNGIKAGILAPMWPFIRWMCCNRLMLLGPMLPRLMGRKPFGRFILWWGYQHTAALVKGFTDHGGFIVNNYVGPMDYKAETYENMIQFIEASEAEVVFLLFSFKEGDKVLHALSQSALNGKLPFVTLPMLTDESFNHRNHHLQQVTSVASWSFDEMLPAMETFVQKQMKPFNPHPTSCTYWGMNWSCHNYPSKDLWKHSQRDCFFLTKPNHRFPKGILNYYIKWGNPKWIPIKCEPLILTKSDITIR